ncbi:hypothetical protein IAU60_003056 [Kwoniella sp. DSM 27419]
MGLVPSPSPSLVGPGHDAYGDDNGHDHLPSSQSTVSTEPLSPSSAAGPSISRHASHTRTPSMASTEAGPTPPTSPLHEHFLPQHATTNRVKKRRIDHVQADSEGSDGEYLPSPTGSACAISTASMSQESLPSALASTSASAPSSASGSAVSLRGGGKKPVKGKRLSAAGTQAAPPSGASGTTHSRRTTRSKAKRASSPSDLITTSLEDIAAEEAAVKAEISRLGLMLRDVQGDGNCLFRVLSDQGFGGEKRHAEIRKLVCDYLEMHKDVMEGFVVPFMKDGEGYEGYVVRMREPKQFGSHIEIQAAARVFRRNIRVVMSTTSFTIPWRTEAYPNAVSETPTPSHVGPVHGSAPRRHRDAGKPRSTCTEPEPAAAAPSSAEYLPPVRDGRGMLWLALFSQAEHFQSIRRLGDREHGPAEIEDRLAVPHARDTSEAARRERGELVEEKNPMTASSKVAQLLASLPAGHGVGDKHAGDILARVKGDVGEAVEILLEEIDMEGSAASWSGSSDHVEEMLPGVLDRKISDYRSRSRTSSPSNTATTSTESRPRSRSLSRDGSHSSDSVNMIYGSDIDQASSSCTTQSEPYGQAGDGRDGRASARRPRPTRDNLSQSLEGMGLATVHPHPKQEDMDVDHPAAGPAKDKAKRSTRSNREALSRLDGNGDAPSRGERRRSARLGVVGA